MGTAIHFMKCYSESEQLRGAHFQVLVQRVSHLQTYEINTIDYQKGCIEMMLKTF